MSVYFKRGADRSWTVTVLRNLNPRWISLSNDECVEFVDEVFVECSARNSGGGGGKSSTVFGGFDCVTTAVVVVVFDCELIKVNWSASSSARFKRALRRDCNSM